MPQPPRAPKRPHLHTEHGVERLDPWHWIKDRDDPETLPLLQAENAWLEEQSAPLAPLRERLYDELLSRIQEDDASPPVVLDGYLYYRRTEQGRPYTLHCRKRGPDAAEELLLDENVLAEGHDYFRLEQLEVSRDHQKIAWLQDLDGGERFTLFVRDLKTGLTTSIATGLKWSLAWSADGAWLFATRSDHAQRPCEIWRFPADGSGTGEQVLAEPDERYFLGVRRSRDWGYLLLEASSKTTSEVYTLDAHRPLEPPKVVWPRRPDVLYDVEPRGAHFYVLSNDEGVNFRLVRVLAADPQGEAQVIRPHDPQVYLTDVQAFANHLVIWERRDGMPAVCVRELATQEEHHIAMPEPAFDVRPEANPSAQSSILRLVYTSPKTPPKTWAYDMATRERTVLKEHPVPGYDPQRYAVELVWATAHDGEAIPISLLRPRHLDLTNGPHPLFLIGYGSYGLSYPASFRSSRISLVDRGAIVGIAHIRGGSERGRHWYENGKFEHKANTFLDFIHATEHLQRSGWTTPAKTVIQGGSAGGLLMGAVMNLRPELFRAVVANVPFVDALNTMLDADLPLTVTEYEEWGDPNEREVFDRLRSYAPYENVCPKPYPATYVTAGLNDPRVGYWEPAKWVQKLRACTTSDEPVLFRVHLGAGHAGKSGRYGQLEDLSWELSFVIDKLGLADQTPELKDR
ncbi:MAG: S9 family peptidase [Deltaproteobacteria bacterium]|nr:MAG: S9 family peptidase [Deltaproteobacteria bacterium]